MRRLRLVLFGIAMLGLLPAVIVVARAMPEFGAHPLPYGEAINARAPHERNVTNMVTAVNFDYRCIDTLGEEYMLLAAVAGTVLLLRGGRGESDRDRPARAPGRTIPPTSEAVTLACRLAMPPMLVFGIYVVLHAQLTPGGGFQGGAIVASALTLLYLGEGYHAWRDLVPGHAADLIEAAGAAIFALGGLIPMAFGYAFLQNVLPLGPSKSLLSGGLIPVLNGGVGFAVAGGFTMLFLEFLEETRAERAKPEQHGARQ